MSDHDGEPALGPFGHTLNDFDKLDIDERPALEASLTGRPCPLCGNAALHVGDYKVSLTTNPRDPRYAFVIECDQCNWLTFKGRKPRTELQMRSLERDRREGF